MRHNLIKQKLTIYHLSTARGPVFRVFLPGSQCLVQYLIYLEFY